MKKIILLLTFFSNIATAQKNTITADKFIIRASAGRPKAKLITNKIYALDRFYLGADTSDFQNEPFDITTNARFGGKIKLGTSYGNTGDYIRSNGPLNNPTWSKIQWSEIEGVPSASNSWVKMPLSGITGNFGFGNATTTTQPDGTTVLPLIFSAGTTRIGELNQYGQLYGFTRLGINIGFTNTQSSMFQPTGQNYDFILGGKASFGFNQNMPTAQKTGTYFIDLNKNSSSDITRFRFTKYEAAGLTNVPKWQLQHGANDDFAIQKLNTNQSIDTTNSIYINSGRFNFGRSTGLNNSKFTFGGGATFLDDIYIPFDGFQSYRLQTALTERPKFGDLNNKISKDSLTISLNTSTGVLSLNGINGFSLANFSTWGNGKYFQKDASNVITGINGFTGASTFSGVRKLTNAQSSYATGKVITSLADGSEVWTRISRTTGLSFSNGLLSWNENNGLDSTTNAVSFDNRYGQLSANNNFTGSNLFLTPVFANSTSTSSFSSMTGEWVGSGNLATFRWRYNTKVGSNTVTWYPLNIDTNGWVGFGMTPSQAFEVLGAAKFNSAITATSIGASGAISSSATSTFNGISLGASDIRSSSNILTLGGTSERVRIDANGNVGIGTTSPQKRLTVSAANNDYAAHIYSNQATGNNFGILLDAGSNSSDYAFRVRSSTTAEYFSVKGNGYVGIGTASPNALIHVKSSTSLVGDYQMIFEGATAGYGAGMSFQSLLAGTSTMKEMARITADGESAWNSTASTQNSLLRFQTTSNGTTREVMRIASTGMIIAQGDLSMNGNYPVISMAGSQSGASNIRLHNYISGISNAGFEIYDQTATASRLAIGANGNIGIGTTSPTKKLDVFGEIQGYNIATIASNANQEGGQLTLLRPLDYTKDWGVDVYQDKLRIFNQTDAIIGLELSSAGNAIMKDITSTKYSLSALNTAPASATATGTTGEIRVTATHIYVCTATNTWVRAALSTW